MNMVKKTLAKPDLTGQQKKKPMGHGWVPEICVDFLKRMTKQI